MKFSLGTLSDAKALAELEEKTFAMPWSLESVEEEIRGKFSGYFVCKKEGMLVGYIGYSIADPDFVDIHNFAIQKEFRGLGLGEKTLRAFFDYMVKMGRNVFFVDVRKSNSIAYKLYVKCGFTEVGVRKNYYDSPREDALVMRKAEAKAGCHS